MQSLWMLVASLLFACMGVCVELVTATHSAVEISFWRSLIALLLSFALVRLRVASIATLHWRCPAGVSSAIFSARWSSA